ncbi:TrmH family RNA methyltransferase [Pontibacillus marinus]|uniref:23S rRNA methyltransferase n=1 Tax=Pontibacillus marinus BH030004 = DSM 16465 TaxID=1385511 RepID=A0A0A5FVJ5_9BACI|nr:RNA methyltransferase [Pontibacillus marinus]KGX84826.1 23S rRNA methyltransferase [Pontibacillus marinus BH030004 = DSM 16465]
MITSVQNKTVKSWRKLQKKRDREKEQSFMVEGFHLVEEAVNSSWDVKEIIVREDVDLPNEWQSYKWFSVTDEVFNAITETEHPQGVAAVINMREPEWGNFSRVLVLDAIQDPGNLGTLIRTADAAGFDAIIAGKGTVDPYNDKALRSTQGSIFHIPVFQGDLKEWLPYIKDKGLSIWATSLKNANEYHTVEPTSPVALLVGNEGAGVQEEYLQFADQSVTIPIFGQAESLNVAIASGILMYYLRN